MKKYRERPIKKEKKNTHRHKRGQRARQYNGHDAPFFFFIPFVCDISHCRGIKAGRHQKKKQIPVAHSQSCLAIFGRTEHPPHKNTRSKQKNARKSVAERRHKNIFEKNNFCLPYSFFKDEKIEKIKKPNHFFFKRTEHTTTPF